MASPATVSMLISSNSRPPNAWPALMRTASASRSTVRPSWANAHATSGSVVTSALAERGDAAQAQRHEREPQRQPDADGDQRATRVGQQQRHGEDAERGPGEHVHGRVAGAARGQPQHGRDRQRGGEPDAVPVVERRAQAGEQLVLGQRAREHLGQQRPRAQEHAGDRDRAQQRAPAPGREPAEREPARQRAEVAEHAVGLQPRLRRRERPADRDRGEDRQQRERAQQPDAAQALRRARVTRHDQRERAQRRAAEHEEDLDPRRALQLRAAARDERAQHHDQRDAAQHDGPGGRQRNVERRDREATAPRDVVPTCGGPGHVCESRGRRRARARRPR